MTALNGLLRRALRMSGGMAPGQTPHTDETADALVVLNAMIDGWSTNRMNIGAIARASYTLVPSQASYTIGPTGNFNTTRPVWIERASILQAASLMEMPLRILRHEEEWQRIRFKSETNSLGWQLYNDKAHPLSTLYLHPIPTVADALILYTWEALSAFTAMTDVLALPPGYEDAMAYNLGVRLAVEWGRNLQNPGEVRRLAKETLSAIQTLNAPAPVMRCDPAYQGSTRSAIDGPNPLWWMFQ